MWREMGTGLSQLRKYKMFYVIRENCVWNIYFRGYLVASYVTEEEAIDSMFHFELQHADATIF